jgi:hypothetical protein
MDRLRTVQLVDKRVRPIDVLVSCPKCDGKHDYVHLGGVVVDQQHETIAIRHDGSTKNPRPAHEDRGSRARINLWCENGHRFELVFQFHTGRTYVTCMRGEDFPEGQHPSELWRE